MPKDCANFGAHTHNLCTPNYNVTRQSDGRPESTDPNYPLFFCTIKGSGGDSYRNEWCKRIGQFGNEWVYDHQGDAECKYDTCQPYTIRSGSDCCNGCCAKKGFGAFCRRTNYNGSAAQCCLNDYGGCNFDLSLNSTTKTNNCFEKGSSDGADCNDNTEDCAGTCDPCLRDVTSNADTFYEKQYAPNGDISGYYVCGRYGDVGSDIHAEPRFASSANQTKVWCQEAIQDYCSGADLNPGDSSWIDRWMQPDGTATPKGCLYAFARNLFYVDENYGPPGSPSPACTLVKAYITGVNQITTNGLCTPFTDSYRGPKYFQASDLITGAMQRYQKDGFVVGAMPGTAGFNPFQDFMYNNVFCKFPGVSEDALLSTCSPYTTQQLSKNPSIANICGCYLQNSEYQTYVDTYQVNPECTPTCNRPGSVKRVNYVGEALYCNQDTCIIDDVAINLAQTQVGEIDISQVCGNCHAPGQPNSPPNSGSSCTCNFSYNTYTIDSSDINELNIEQQCTTSNCTIFNSVTNQYETLPCSDAPARLNVIAQQQLQLDELRREARMRRNRNILIFLGVLVLLLVIAWFFIRPNFYDEIPTDIYVQSTRKQTNKPQLETSS